MRAIRKCLPVICLLLLPMFAKAQSDGVVTLLITAALVLAAIPLTMLVLLLLAIFQEKRNNKIFVTAYVLSAIVAIGGFVIFVNTSSYGYGDDFHDLGTYMIVVPGVYALIMHLVGKNKKTPGEQTDAAVSAVPKGFLMVQVLSALLLLNGIVSLLQFAVRMFEYSVFSIHTMAGIILNGLLLLALVLWTKKEPWGWKLMLALCAWLLSGIIYSFYYVFVVNAQHYYGGTSMILPRFLELIAVISIISICVRKDMSGLFKVDEKERLAQSGINIISGVLAFAMFNILMSQMH